MNALTLSWAICSVPHVKAAVTNRHMRETAERIHQRHGSCGGIACSRCPLHDDAYLSVRLTIECYGPEVDIQRRSTEILSIVLNRGRP